MLRHFNTHGISSPAVGNSNAKANDSFRSPVLDHISKRYLDRSGPAGFTNKGAESFRRNPRTAPESGSALNLDRFLRARFGHLTFGLSPAGLLLVYLDWLAHVAISPGKHYDLARKMWRKAVRFAFYAARSGWRSGTPPAIEPLPQDDRFDDPAWQRWPFNLYYQSFLFAQQWLYNATNGVRGVSPHHEQVLTFVGRQLLRHFRADELCLYESRGSQGHAAEQKGGTLFAECRTSLRIESERCWNESQPERGIPVGQNRGRYCLAR